MLFILFLCNILFENKATSCYTHYTQWPAFFRAEIIIHIYFYFALKNSKGSHLNKERRGMLMLLNFSTFILGLLILVIGGFFYGKFCDKVFEPDDRETPAVALNDGVDFVPMKKWKNSLIELLNIAGTGPILGPIQGILFGPLAFLLIPLGCVLSGAVHDYMVGMICLREEGKQMPKLIQKYLGNKTFNVYNVFVCLLMLLVGAVFIYTPGDLIVGLIGAENTATSPVVWIVYGCIFVYYLVATLFPIDAIIGRIYPIFGIILVLSAVGVFFGIFAQGYELTALTRETFSLFSLTDHSPVIPIFFVTVACGITSGFHASQATLIARSVSHEREGRMTFYNMMIVEGFIAMIWAAASMGIYAKIQEGLIPGVDMSVAGTASIITLVAKDLLGPIGGVIAIVGVIVLPITSGDTALRSIRLMLAEYFNYDQSKKQNRLTLSAGIFICCAAILIFAKVSASGFNILWRYFSWANQTIAIFAFAMVTVYLYARGKNFIFTLIPGMFYSFIISSFIINAKIGLNIPMNIAYVLGGIFTVLWVLFTLHCGKKIKAKMEGSSTETADNTVTQ